MRLTDLESMQRLVDFNNERINELECIKASLTEQL
jgi:hypothetical protein